MFSLTTLNGHNFIRELAYVQSSWAEVLLKSCDVDYQRLEKTINDSRHLISGEPLINISKQYFMKLTQDIVKLLKKHQPKFKGDLLLLGKRYDEFYETLLTGDELTVLQWAEKSNISPIMIGYLTDWVLRPEKLALGKIVQPLIHDKCNWQSNCCPVCNEETDIAILLKENGERHLGCSCCNVTWRYPRLLCALCETTSPAAMKYYFMEDAREQQIHYCESCGNYMKTIDYRYTDEKHEDLTVLNYMTAHLDVLAEQKGLGCIIKK